MKNKFKTMLTLKYNKNVLFKYFRFKDIIYTLKKDKKNCKKRQPHRKNSRNRLDCNNPGRKEKYIILQMLIYECVKKN